MGPWVPCANLCDPAPHHALGQHDGERVAGPKDQLARHPQRGTRELQQPAQSLEDDVEGQALDWLGFSGFSYRLATLGNKKYDGLPTMTLPDPSLREPSFGCGVAGSGITSRQIIAAPLSDWYESGIQIGSEEEQGTASSMSLHDVTRRQASLCPVVPQTSSPSRSASSVVLSMGMAAGTAPSTGASSHADKSDAQPRRRSAEPGRWRSARSIGPSGEAYP